MVSIDKKTGIIDAGDGWSIRISSNTLEVYDNSKSYSFSSEIVENGLKIIVFNDLASKGYDEEITRKLLNLVADGLEGIGLVVEFE